MNDRVVDEVGTLKCEDAGTTDSPGMIGRGRRFRAGEGIKCGQNITNYPTGAGPSTSEAWFRAVAPTRTSSPGGMKGAGAAAR